MGHHPYLKRWFKNFVLFIKFFQTFDSFFKVLICFLSSSRSSWSFFSSWFIAKISFFIPFKTAWTLKVSCYCFKMISFITTDSLAPCEIITSGLVLESKWVALTTAPPPSAAKLAETRDAPWRPANTAPFNATAIDGATTPTPATTKPRRQAKKDLD